MAEISESLSRTMKSKVLGLKSDQNSSSLLKVIAKNFMSIRGGSTGMARDLNIASQNIKTLLSIMGGTPRDDVDMHFLKEGEREKKLEVDLAKEDGKPTPTMKPKKKEGILDKLKKQFTSNNFIKSAMKYFAIASIIGVIVASFKDTFVQWVTGLWDSIKESFDEFVTDIKSWFSEVVNKIVEGVKEAIKPFIDGISSFFTKVSDVFISYFEIWKSVITAPFEIIKSIYDKFVGGLKSLVDKLPDWLKEKLGITKEEPKKTEKPLSDSDKRKKLEQEKETLDTERVRKQEEEKQYKGDDEIIRKRLGIEDKTKTMKDEELKKAPQVAAAPSAPAPSAAPSKEKKDEKPLEVSGVQATIIDALKQSGVESSKAHANVLATVKAESNFKVQSENLNYSSPDRIQAVFGKKRIPTVEFAQQFVKNPQALANHVYKTTDGNAAEGDGFKFRGRGFIQHTGKNQYSAISKFTGIDVMSNPDALNSPEVAAKAIPWFLLSYKKMKPEDIENMSKVNKAIAFADPTGQKALAREQSAQQIHASMSGGSGAQVASASGEVSSGQRQQQKSSTPVIVNAPTTNNTNVKKTQTASAPPPRNTANGLVARAT
jgi:putative chitinase